MSWLDDLQLNAAIARSHVERREREQAQENLDEKKRIREREKQLKDFNLQGWAKKVARSLGIEVTFGGKDFNHQVAVFWVKDNSFFKVHAYVNVDGSITKHLEYPDVGSQKTVDITKIFTDHRLLEEQLSVAYKATLKS